MTVNTGAKKRTALIILNDFAHDLSSGFWLSCIIVLALLDRKTAGAVAPAAEALREVMRTFFWITVAALAAVIATGIVRSVTYRPPVDEGTAGTKRTLLYIKHALFAALFAGGTWLAYAAAYR